MSQVHPYQSLMSRLRLLGNLTDPFILRQVDHLGLATHWRCLEVGAGLGSLSQALAGRLGRGGHMLCTDLIPDLMAGLSAPNLETRVVDYRSQDLPGGVDLVLARSVLNHQPQWADLLERMLGALRPGGALLVVEPDFSAGLRDPQLGLFWSACVEGARQGGVDALLGGKLPAKLSGMGMMRVAGEALCPLFPGGSSWARYWLESMEPMEAQFLGGPVESHYREFQKKMADPSYWTQVASFTAAWGYRKG